MKNISKTIIFFGTDDFSLTIVQELIESGYNIAAVVTKPDNKSGRGHKIEMSETKKFAISKNINVWQPVNVSEINAKIMELGPNIIGVLASYGKIIPKSTIDLFKLGIINVHPSLLPIYRGPSPIESAIANNDTQTGVSIMQLSPEMDAGPVYGYIIHKLSGTETSIILRNDLANDGASALISLLPGIISGSIIPAPQNNRKAVYCNLLTKDDALLRPNEITAVQAECLVRAYLIYPKTKFTILNHSIIITKAHVSTSQKSITDIRCKDNNYLSIDELIAPSGRIMSGTDFINGYSVKP